MHLNVDARIPRGLLAGADPLSPHPKRLGSTRVPRLRVRSVTWNMPTAAELSTPIFAITGVDSLEFGHAFEDSLEAVAWPRRLKNIKFHYDSPFNQSIELVKWPESLQTLQLRSKFNQPIGLEHWPASLHTIMLGVRWNHPIEDVTWPPSVRQLTFGTDFNQPIERAMFPALLETLAFGMKFNHPIEGTVWPDSVERLVFGWHFNQPVDNVRWPASLQELTFGSNRTNPRDGLTMLFSTFNQRIGSSVWPASLRRLTLGGDSFRQSLEGLGIWMPNLETFHYIDYRRSSGLNLLRGVQWPTGLRQLTVCMESSIDGVVIPQTVEVLHLHSESTRTDLAFFFPL
ncbi:unnamed protein product [Ectocarpus fasciculatus]